MTRPSANDCVSERGDERGFALLAVLSIIAAGSLVLLAAVQRLVPPLAGRARLVDDRLAVCQEAVEIAYRRDGSFPANLTALATPAGLDANGVWRRDPSGFAVDFAYNRNGTRVQLRSRGPDRRLNTADDVIETIPAERPLRTRQRGRLRLLRALLLVSPYRTSGSMTTADLAAMRTAMRDHAIATRRWLGADAATRTSLATTLTANATTITNLLLANVVTALPTGLTGAGGLLTAIGATDAAGVDGRGMPFYLHPTLGIAAAGNDRTQGTDDDM
jgi:hypothetical protein